MRKPVIVCDIDDVVFPFVDNIALHYNQQFGASLTPEDFVSFNFYEVWGGTQEEANGIVEGFLAQPCLELSPLKGAVEAFTRLKEDFDIVLVTARNGIFEEGTVGWLRQHFPDLFDRAIFAGNAHDGRGFRTKGEICRELEAVLIIDDHPSNVLSAVNQGVDGILFGTKAWTLEAIDKLHNTVHCHDWSAVEEYIYGKWQHKQFS